MQPPGGTKHAPPGQLALVAQACPEFVHTPAVAAASVVTSPARARAATPVVRGGAPAAAAATPVGLHIPSASAVATLKVWSTRSSAVPFPLRSVPPVGHPASTTGPGCSHSKVRKVTV